MEKITSCFILNFKVMKLNICILLFISCISCQTSTKEYTQFVNQYLNRQLKLPQHILIKHCSDSIYLQNPAKYTSDSIYRITTYIYGDCYACVEDLIKWKQLLSQFPPDKVRFLCFIYAEIYSSFEIMNERSIHFTQPIIYDPENHYIKMNKLPDNKLLNTFLIDPNGKIVVIGNPIISNKIATLYKNEIDRAENDI